MVIYMEQLVLQIYNLALLALLCIVLHSHIVNALLSSQLPMCWCTL